jgi:hypothetical protein
LERAVEECFQRFRIPQFLRYYTDGARKSANGNYDGKRDKYEYHGTLTPVEDHTFVFGADHARESAAVEIAGTTAATRGPLQGISVNNEGLFANYQVALFDKSLTLTFGARQDDHETLATRPPTAPPPAMSFRESARVSIPATAPDSMRRPCRCFTIPATETPS